MTRPLPLAPVQAVAQLAAWTTGLLSFWRSRCSGRAANRVTLSHDGLRRACQHPQRQGQTVRHTSSHEADRAIIERSCLDEE
jgi:hypothetical protein